MVTQLYDTPAPAAVARPGFWRRAAAYLIDSALIVVAWIAVSFAIGMLAAALVEDTPVYDATILSLGLWVLFGPFATWFVYEWLFNARGSSPAKSRLDITVTNASGLPPGARAGFLRTIGMIVGVIPFGLGYWWAIWDPRDRAWHDMMSGTDVVRRGHAPYPGAASELPATVAAPSQRGPPTQSSAMAAPTPASSVRSRLNSKQGGADTSRALSVREAIARRRR